MWNSDDFKKTPNKWMCKTIIHGTSYVSILDMSSAVLISKSFHHKLTFLGSSLIVKRFIAFITRSQQKHRENMSVPKSRLSERFLNYPYNTSHSFDDNKIITKTILNFPK